MFGAVARLGCLAGIAMLASGCMADGYAPPDGISPQSGAEVVGSKMNHKSILFAGELRTYLVEIDGKATHMGPNQWASTRLLTPGAHEVKMAVWKLGSDIGLTQPQTITLAAGKTYTVRTDDLMVDDKGMSTAVWLQADDGAAVGDKAPVLLEPSRGKCN